MFDFLKRGRLVRRGLATRKTRRRRLRNELMRYLEYAPYSVGFSDRHYSTLDQSTKKFFAKLADFADFRRHSGATRCHEATVGDLQQRQLQAP